MTIYKEGSGILGLPLSKALKPDTVIQSTYAFMLRQDQNGQDIIQNLSAKVINDHEVQIDLNPTVIIDLVDPDSDPYKLREIEYWIVRGLVTLQRFTLVYKAK